MTMRVPRVHRYDGGEFMLAYGPLSGPQLMILQPLFEEMNRCRAMVAGTCRLLAERGIGTWLPDLPGTGESPCALETVDWEDWLRAVEAAAQVVHAETGTEPSTFALRGGALLDQPTIRPALRLAPTSGRSLLSDLRRSALASGSDTAHPAGYKLAPSLAQALAAAEPAPLGNIRTIRLFADDRPADRRIDGQPLWRRPEPAIDATTVRAIGEEIVAWMMS